MQDTERTRESTKTRSYAAGGRTSREEASLARQHPRPSAREEEGKIPPPPWSVREGRTVSAAPIRRDYILRAMLYRCVAAVVALCCCVLLRMSGSGFYRDFSAGYNRLLNQPLSHTAAAWNDLLERIGVASVFGQIEDAVMVFAGREQVPISEPSSSPGTTVGEEAPTVTGQAGGEALSGQGGWMPWNRDNGKETRTAPAGTTLEQPRLTARARNPVSGRLTSAFGYRIHPTTGEEDFHTGIDIAAPKGTPIRAAWPGVVTEVGSSAIYGNYIVLEHGESLSTRYCHCDTIVAEEGWELRAGEQVATVGSTGISTGAHLHFEVMVGGLCANPLAAFDLS